MFFGRKSSYFLCEISLKYAFSKYLSFLLCLRAVSYSESIADETLCLLIISVLLHPNSKILPKHNYIVQEYLTYFRYYKITYVHYNENQTDIIKLEK